MADGRREPESSGSKLVSGYRKAQPYLDAAWLMTGSVMLGVVVGYFLDQWLHTKPWMLLVGSAVGMVAGFYGFIRAVLSLDKRNSANKR